MKNLPSIEIFSVENTIEKEQKKKVEKTFSNKCVSSQKIRMRKEEGATIGVCRPFCLFTFPSGQSRVGRTGSVLHGSLQAIGKLPLTTTNVLPSKRRRFQSQLIDKIFCFFQKRKNFELIIKTDEQRMKLIRCR